MHCKSDRCTSVAPCPAIDDERRASGFLVEVFDAEGLRWHEADDGRLQHGEMRIDGTVVMLADGLPGWPAIASHAHVHVADVDAVHRRALAAGATAVQEPAREDDADRRGGFREPGGTTGWVATQGG